MTELSLLPTEMAQWHALVNDAEALSQCQLDVELESYIVFLLMRFVNKPELAKSVISADFLRGLQDSGAQRLYRMKEVGDKCLLFSGLFPGIAERRNLKIEYFVEIGQSAYQLISEQNNYSSDDLYSNLSHQFLGIVRILKSLRQNERIFTFNQKTSSVTTCDNDKFNVSLPVNEQYFNNLRGFIKH